MECDEFFFFFHAVATRAIAFLPFLLEDHFLLRPSLALNFISASCALEDDLKARGLLFFPIFPAACVVVAFLGLAARNLLPIEAGASASLAPFSLPLSGPRVLNLFRGRGLGAQVKPRDRSDADFFL